MSTRTFEIDFSWEQWAALENQANNNGMTPTGFLRFLAEAQIEQQPLMFTGPTFAAKTHNINYILELVELDGRLATFESTQSNIRLVLPVPDWLSLGKPGEVRVETFGVHPVQS